MLVDMENVEFPEEADRPDQEQHDRHEEVEVRQDIR